MDRLKGPSPHSRYWIALTVAALAVGVLVTLIMRELAHSSEDVRAPNATQVAMNAIQTTGARGAGSTPGSTLSQLQGSLPQTGGIETEEDPRIASGTATSTASATAEKTESATSVVTPSLTPSSETPQTGETATPQPTLSPTVDDPVQPTWTTVPTYPDGIEQRPYTSDSIWNTPISRSAELDPHSSDMIAAIGMDSGGRITSDPNQYTYPVYYADESTPRWDIPCTRYKCTIVMVDSVIKQSELKNVPIPADARPSAGSDGQMIIIDTITKAEYNLWQAIRTTDGWSISNGSVYNITWDGMPSKYGSRGAGVPYLAGLVRPFEILKGRIDHALAFGFSYARRDRCVFPASKTDGNSTLPNAIPQGARIQLDPSLTEADFDRIGLSPTGKIIARALQEYGMFLIDNSGRPKIYVEDLTTNPYALVHWTDPNLALNSTTIADLPYSSFRVLKLPDNYWAEGELGPWHGECFVDPDDVR